MSTYNRLPNPIAIIGYRSAYMHLCEHCGIDPHNNDLFYRVAAADDIAFDQKFSRVLEIDGATETEDYHRVRTLALDRVVNTTTANKSNLGLDLGN